MRVQSTPFLHRSHSEPALSAVEDKEPNSLKEVSPQNGPNAAPGDEFLANDSTGVLEREIRSFVAFAGQKKEMRKTSDVIVNCLSPFLSKKGPLDENVWLVLLRILGKIRAERRDLQSEEHEILGLQQKAKHLESSVSENQKSKMEELTKQIEQACTNVQAGFKELSDEESLSFGAMTGVLASQHEANMATLREIRAS